MPLRLAALIGAVLLSLPGHAAVVAEFRPEWRHAATWFVTSGTPETPTLLAQSFVAERSGILTSISVPLGRNGASRQVTVALELRPTEEGKVIHHLDHQRAMIPSETILGSALLHVTDAPWTPVYYTVSFRPQRVRLEEDTLYAIVLRSISGAGVWASVSQRDSRALTYAEGAPFRFSHPANAWLGGPDDLADHAFAVHAVPVPGSLALLGPGLAALLAYRRLATRAPAPRPV